jgi:2,4-dienoyl-CoA reductase-like NADH-dependent reductase (Old Yellow Enzyme family)
MTASTDALCTPFTIKQFRFANRIVMAPMTRSFSPGEFDLVAIGRSPTDKNSGK